MGRTVGWLVGCSQNIMKIFTFAEICVSACAAATAVGIGILTFINISKNPLIFIVQFVCATHVATIILLPTVSIACINGRRRAQTHTRIMFMHFIIIDSNLALFMT